MLVRVVRALASSPDLRLSVVRLAVLVALAAGVRTVHGGGAG